MSERKFTEVHTHSSASVGVRNVSMTMGYELLDSRLLLDNAHIELVQGHPCLIVGEGNAAYHALGGVLAGLLPITEADVPWESMKKILLPFTGNVTITGDKLPEPSVYIGPDPDRLLLFSKVVDNFRVHGYDHDQSIDALSRFGLGSPFLRRRLAALSGGERMRVALALAFSGEHETLILDGVVPWLDSEGREALSDQITLSSTSCIVLLGNEWENLHSIVRKVYRLTDGKLVPFDNGAFNSKASRPIRKCTFVHPESKPLLRFDNVHFSDYPDSEVERKSPLLHSVAFSVYPGEHVCIIGPNGAGKSTIAKLIYGLLRPDNGHVQLNGSNVAPSDRPQISAMVAYLGQYPMQQLVLPSVGSYKIYLDGTQNLAASRLIDSWVNAEERELLINLTTLDLKLLALASGITNDTQLLVLDEPTWGLSVSEQTTLIEYLTTWREELPSRSILLISHNQRFADELGGRLLFLHDGVVDDIYRFSSKKPFADGDNVIGEKRLRSLLGGMHLLLKVAVLLAVAVFCFGFVFFVRESDLGWYSLALGGVASTVVLVLRGTVRRSEFRLLFVAWAVGSLIYFAIATVLVFSGTSLSPYMELKSLPARWLYTLSYPFRIITVLATGMLFFEFTSPLEFGRSSAAVRRAGLLFRAVEYAKEQLVDTVGAMAMLNRWPHVPAKIFRARQVWRMLRQSPEVVATVIRNILIWSPWAWMIMSKEVQQPDLKRGVKR